MQMTSKNGFSRCGELYIGRLREEDAIPRRMFIKTPSFLSANSAACPMCRSDKSPVDVYDATGSIFMSVA